MKLVFMMLGLILGCIISMNSFAQNGPYANYKILSDHAKALYETFTDAKQESTGGNTYREGKSILCWHVDGNMNDAQGQAIAIDDPRRYFCSIHFNDRGLATPGDQF